MRRRILCTAPVRQALSACSGALEGGLGLLADGAQCGLVVGQREAFALDSQGLGALAADRGVIAEGQPFLPGC